MSVLRRAFRRFEDERTPDSSTFQLRVVVEADDLDGGFIASVLDMPGCISQGETRQEAANNALEAFTEMLAATLDAQIELDETPPETTKRTPAPRIQEYKVAVGC